MTMIIKMFHDFWQPETRLFWQLRVARLVNYIIDEIHFWPPYIIMQRKCQITELFEDKYRVDFIETWIQLIYFDRPQLDYFDSCRQVIFDNYDVYWQFQTGPEITWHLSKLTGGNHLHCFNLSIQYVIFT